MGPNFLNNIELDCKQVFVFDWDGTLFDSMAIKLDNFSTLLAERLQLLNRQSDCYEQVKKIYQTLSGKPRKEIFKAVIAQFNLEESTVNYSDFNSQLSTLNQIRLAEANLFSDVDPFLLKLLQAGKTMFISSSTPQDELDFLVSQKLNNHLSNCIVQVLGSSEGFSKGAEHIKFICQKINCRKEEILFIGDDLADLELSNSANIDCILIDRNSRFDSLGINRLDSLATLGGTLT